MSRLGRWTRWKPVDEELEGDLDALITSQRASARPMVFITHLDSDHLNGLQSIDHACKVDAGERPPIARNADRLVVLEFKSHTGKRCPAAGDEHLLPLITPPWGGLPNIVAIIAGRKYYDDVVKPTLADVQYEYLEARRLGNDRLASCVKWFGLLRIIYAVTISPLLCIARMLISSKA